MEESSDFYALFKIDCFIEIIAGLHAVLRCNIEIICMHCPDSPNGNVLESYIQDYLSDIETDSVH